MSASPENIAAKRSPLHRRAGRSTTAGIALLAIVALLGAGCGTSKGGGRGRGVAAGLLLGMTAIAAGGTIAAANVANKKEEDLRKDVDAGTLTGRQFAERDEEGKRWNRYARASAFVAGLSLVGLLIVGEMALADRHQYGELPPPNAKPIIPGQSPEPPAGKLPLPGR